MKSTSIRSAKENKLRGATPKKKDLLQLMDCPEVQSWRALMHAFKSIFVQLEKGLMVDNCSMPRFQILFLLYLEDRMPAVEIARRLLVTRGNVSMFLRRMESDRLVTTIIPEGQKRPLYCLTKDGTSFFESLLPPHIKRVQQYAPRLSQACIDKLNVVCKK